jgi:phage shock protein PspC (stress-responsive transcriptional regulator)
MNPQNNFNWQQALGELKAKLDRSPLLKVNLDNYPAVQTLYNQFLDKFQRLPKPGQVAVFAVGTIILLTVFNTILQLISALITLTVAGVLIYIAYKLVISPQSSNNNDQ